MTYGGRKLGYRNEAARIAGGGVLNHPARVSASEADCNQAKPITVPEGGVRKKITAFAFFTIAGFLAAGNALAQHVEVRATVPFSFTAGGKVLPSGDYSITSVSHNAIAIRSQGQRVAMLAQAFGTVDQSKSGSVLVFERHGDLYSLRKILCEPQGMNVRLPVEHWKRGSYTEEAMNSPTDGLVLIAVGY